MCDPDRVNPEKCLRFRIRFSVFLILAKTYATFIVETLTRPIQETKNAYKKATHDSDLDAVVPAVRGKCEPGRKRSAKSMGGSRHRYRGRDFGKCAHQPPSLFAALPPGCLLPPASKDRASIPSSAAAAAWALGNKKCMGSPNPQTGLESGAPYPQRQVGSRVLD